MSVPTLQIRLGWPARALSPNVQCHYLTEHKAKKKAKSDARLRTLAARSAVGARGWVEGQGKIAVSVVATPPCTRNRDEDNLVASLKAALDGVAEALCVNDSRFKLDGVTFLPPSPLDSHVYLTLKPIIEE